MRYTSWPKGRCLLAGVAVVSLALLSGCVGNGDEDAGGAAESEFQESGGSSERAVDDSAAAVAETVSVDPTLELIKTGTIALESDDVDGLLGELDVVVAEYAGVVESEDVRTDDEGDARSASVVVRVPVDRFDAAVDEIATLGTLVRQQRSTEDVTTRVADVDARVASAQRSIESLQRLFDRATRLSDVIRLESELSRRQADLESLQAQQRSLARQTAMSTINLSVDRAEVVEREDEDRAGFLDGLESGWSGLVTFVGGTVHALGLVLPLGTLALVVAGAGWFAVRRLRPPGRDAT
jgi:Domain of unknown function (DUF4349)